jgi:hypothetical protein
MGSIKQKYSGEKILMHWQLLSNKFNKVSMIIEVLTILLSH